MHHIRKDAVHGKLTLLELIQTYAQSGNGGLEMTVVQLGGIAAHEAHGFGELAAGQCVLFCGGQTSACFKQILFHSHIAMTAVDDH